MYPDNADDMYPDYADDMYPDNADDMYPYNADEPITLINPFIVSTPTPNHVWKSPKYCIKIWLQLKIGMQWIPF